MLNVTGWENGNKVIHRRICMAFLFTTFSSVQAETSTEDLFDISLEELMNTRIYVGSRTGNNKLGSAKVPVEVVTADELRRSGYSELPKALNHLLSSFTYNNSSVNDLTDHARPFSLNGLKADQVLVLMNGKRIHHGSVLFVNNSQFRGGTGVDLNNIPIEIIQRIEVLRDGASALYGSDAIAGVINIVLKKKSENEVVASAGQRKEGDGEIYSATYNHSTENLFASLEYKNKSSSNTTGLDRRDYYFDGDPRNGNYKETHRVGDAEFENIAVTVNGDQRLYNKNFYYFGKFIYKESEAAGFFRRPRDDRNVRVIYPDGFLPEIAPEQTDIFASLGHRGKYSGYAYDISNTIGYNRFKIKLENTLNASLGAGSPTSFNAGTLSFWQNTINLDIEKSFEIEDSTPLNLAFGGEYRREDYRIKAGETASWIDGLVPVLDGPNAGADTVGGSQVYPGFSPENKSDVTRDVVAIYSEIGYQLLDNLEGKIALRDEYYSDFNNTLNGKASLFFEQSKKLSFRSSIASGYRAPSLQQRAYYKTATEFFQSGGQFLAAQSGTFPVDHELAKLLGSEELDPEKSISANIGLTYKPVSNLTLDLGYYTIKIEDRVILSGGISSSASIPADALAYMTNNGISVAQYFMNAVDTTTSGYDATLKYETKINNDRLTVTGQYHHNETDIDNINIPSEVSSLADDIFSRQEQERLTHYLPEDKAILSVKYKHGDVTVFGKANYFGKTLYVRSASDKSLDQWFDAKTTFDLDIDYKISSNINIAVGGQNIFDTLPDYSNQEPPFLGKGNIIQFRSTNPFDYTGAFYYVRSVIRF